MISSYFFFFKKIPARRYCAAAPFEKTLRLTYICFTVYVDEIFFSIVLEQINFSKLAP